jgi:hypothetical protein
VGDPKLFESYSNTRFKQLPFSPDEINDLFSNENILNNPTNQQAGVQTKVERKQLRDTAHWGVEGIFNRKDQPETRTNEETKYVAEFVAWCKQQYPSSIHDTDLQILQFAHNAYQDIDLVAQWKHFEWVFCDIDDTLIIDGQINHGVINLIEQYHQQWKSITIWTWWDLKDQRQLLDQLWIIAILQEKNISHTLASKYDYAWASVEISIDDFDQNRLIVNNAIKSQTHIDPARLFVSDNNKEINNLKDRLED